ncbi:hypothetical protein [Winogradskyella forsetii]|uniref:hypothetical protein n=1 Tax=Winogradskyella forsetii TaxID=2686077 RepID=UPI0015C02914|nr:hypothetical protein [Winogradskyella forsetii]
MKKVFTLCLFVFAMFLGNQSVVAQNSKLEAKQEINSEAADKTEALRQYVKFSKEQRNEIYTALQSYGQSKARIAANPVTEAEVAKIEKLLDDRVKSILNDEQYERYKVYIAENQ